MLELEDTLMLMGIGAVLAKLLGYINWPWAVVLMPFYIVPLLVLVGVILFLIVDYYNDRNNNRN